ncbi:hypothetical protein ABBQ38_006831 [Trebouxia sp. C0009 RCD-2024]
MPLYRLGKRNIRSCECRHVPSNASELMHIQLAACPQLQCLMVVSNGKYGAAVVSVQQALQSHLCNANQDSQHRLVPMAMGSLDDSHSGSHPLAKTVQALATTRLCTRISRPSMEMTASG